MAMAATKDVWPNLEFSEWQDTCATLHLWTQVVGKIRLKLAPMVNHWWQVTLYVTARGLTTSAMPYRGALLQIDFDFCRSPAGVAYQRWSSRTVSRSRRRPVADFYADVMARLRALGVDVDIWTMPSEIEGAIPFDQDRQHAAYDADAAQRFWRQLVQADRVLNIFRARFLGKCSPVHFFWGSFDLAVTRFSGRSRAADDQGAPNVGDWVMREAYSHEVSSCGFWPGNGGFGEGGVLLPTPIRSPPGFAASAGAAGGAYYDKDLGQFILPYDAVRTATRPGRDAA